MFSDDGIAWTTAGSPTDEWSSVTYGGGLFVAVAGLSPTGVMTSPDGQTWTSRTAPLGDWYGVTYGDGVFVAVGSPSLGPDVVMISYTPTLTSVSPTSGPLTGNTSVTLTGTHLTGATGVTFGGVTAPFTVVSDTQITATSPMHAAGPAAVLVTLPGGSVAGVYTFADAPRRPGRRRRRPHLLLRRRRRPASCRSCRSCRSRAPRPLPPSRCTRSRSP